MRGWCVTPHPNTDGAGAGVSVNIWNANRRFWNAYIVNMENEAFTETFMQQFFADGMRAIRKETCHTALLESNRIAKDISPNKLMKISQ